QADLMLSPPSAPRWTSERGRTDAGEPGAAESACPGRRFSGVNMKRRYFGTDGIRGQSNIFPMTPDLAMRVGIAVGTIFRRGAHRHRVVIGKDTRLSGYMLENAMVAGFTAAGIDAFILGPIPTPAVAMLTRSLRADIGVMISASHNPFYDNG